MEGIYGKRRYLGGLENLGNVIGLVEVFKKEIRKEEIRQIERRKEKEKKRALNLEAKMFRKSELLEKYTVKILFGWNNKKFKDKSSKKF